MLLNRNCWLKLTAIWASFYGKKGDYSEAIKLIDEALALEVKANLRRIEGVDRNNIGLVYKSSGKYTNSLNYISESLTIAQEVVTAVMKASLL